MSRARVVGSRGEPAAGPVGAVGAAGAGGAGDGPDADRSRDLPRGLPGLDPAWSRIVRAPDAQGVQRAWHVLDSWGPGTRGRSVGVSGSPSDASGLGGASGSGTAATPDSDAGGPTGVMLCVHGNPTWSYLWRRFLAQAPPGWRVLAVDQLGMGYSEHPSGTVSQPRTLAERIEDLGALTQALGLGPPGPPVVAVGHDWGGIVVCGWASRFRAAGGRLAGLVLANTAVQHEFSTGLPRPLRPARTDALHAAVTVRTPTFVRAATALSRPTLPREVRDAFTAPYRTAADRSFVGQFVADIPAEPDHPSRATLDAVAEGLARLGATGDVPALLLRGPRDPVFSEAHLRDLRARLPRADVHRYENAGHLVTEDAPRSAADTWQWVATVVEPGLTGDAETTSAKGTAAGPDGPAWSRLLERVRETPDDLAVAEVRSGRRMSFAQFEEDVRTVAAGLAEHGVRPGERVALLVPPGIDLTVAVYACWRIGAVIVVADAGLGLPGMGRALRGAGPAHVIGIAKGLAATAAMRVPGRRILAPDPTGARLDRRLGAALPRAVRIDTTLEAVRAAGRGRPAPEHTPDPDAEYAVLFTSGATGPAKGVVYRSAQLRAQAEHVRAIYGLTDSDRFVAAFAPFALYGPAMGVGSVVPDMDVTAPATLSAAGLADAVLAADATTVFASPASLRNIVATAGELDARGREAMGRVRVAMSAGAPIPVAMMRRVADVLPHAVLHTPYGMTECLPVSDIELVELEEIGPGDGVCVGRPLPGVQVRIAPLPAHPDEPDGELTASPDVTGEIVVSAAHVKARYDQLWATQHDSSRDGVGEHGPWHRTGDVGHLDAAGRLWVQGRRVHVVHTAAGPLTPVAIEQRVLDLPDVADAAVVGVGPPGAQAVVVVVRPQGAGVGRFERLDVRAPLDVAARVREIALQTEPRLSTPGGPGVAAVLQTAHFPVDIRHQSKVDRAALARWATRVLAGGRVGRP